LAKVPNSCEIPTPSAALDRSLFTSLKIAHFGCHAKLDAMDPSDGGLLLFHRIDKTVDKLSIYTISETDTPSAWLAFLSACHTADLDFIDEVIHIAGAFQITGFPQAVGTLWQVEDNYASTIVKTFYENLSRHGVLYREKERDRDSVVMALHEATLKARDEDQECVLSWAPFVIFGA
jgi:CHAT domain-containing protein